MNDSSLALVYCTQPIINLNNGLNISQILILQYLVNPKLYLVLYIVEIGHHRLSFFILFQPLVKHTNECIRMKLIKSFLIIRIQLAESFELLPPSSDFLLLVSYLFLIHEKVSNEHVGQVNARDGCEEGFSLIILDSSPLVLVVLYEVFQTVQSEDSTSSKVCSWVFTLKSNLDPIFGEESFRNWLIFVFMNLLLVEFFQRKLKASLDFDQ